MPKPGTPGWRVSIQNGSNSACAADCGSVARSRASCGGYHPDRNREFIIGNTGLPKCPYHCHQDGPATTARPPAIPAPAQSSATARPRQPGCTISTAAKAPGANTRAVSLHPIATPHSAPATGQRRTERSPLAPRAATSPHSSIAATGMSLWVEPMLARVTPAVAAIATASQHRTGPRAPSVSRASCNTASSNRPNHAPCTNASTRGQCASGPAASA